MAKEKVYIVLSHVHSLKKDPKTGKGIENAWEVAEKVEFVNHLKNRHHTTSVAIGDYINRTMITGARSGMTEYSQFEDYIRAKYAKQMGDLDKMYSTAQIHQIATEPLFTDQFGNVREKTVFDV